MFKQAARQRVNASTTGLGGSFVRCKQQTFIYRVSSTILPRFLHSPRPFEWHTPVPASPSPLEHSPLPVPSTHLSHNLQFISISIVRACNLLHRTSLACGLQSIRGGADNCHILYLLIKVVRTKAQ